MLKWSAKVPRGAPHTKGIPKNPRWSYQKWMEWSINALSWETFPPFFLHGIPLPDIKVVEVFIPKTSRELCSFGCLLCIVTYPKKKKSTLKTPAVLLPQSSHPQLLWVASTPPSWAPLWLPPHLPITRLVASPAPPLRPTALQRVAVVTTARCGRAAPGAVMGSFGWSLGGVAAWWFLGGKRCGIFWGPKITKSKCEKERDSK